MNFLSKLILLPCAALLAGMVLAGCSSTDEPDLSDNPTSPTATATPANAGTSVNTGTPATAGAPVNTGASANTGAPTDDVDQEAAGAPRFAAGETVTVGTSTGSEEEQGPVAAGGQPYLIAEDGTITLPLIGKVQAAGKTPGELQDEITKLYVPSYFMSLAVTVTAQYRVFYVGGEVIHPGPEVYTSATTVTKAIQAAGDFTQFSSHTVWLTRGADGTRVKVNVDKALRDPTQDPPVFPGDQIHVPRRYF